MKGNTRLCFADSAHGMVQMNRVMKIPVFCLFVFFSVFFFGGGGGLSLYVPVNNFSVMSGLSHRLLSITGTCTVSTKRNANFLMTFLVGKN